MSDSASIPSGLITQVSQGDGDSKDALNLAELQESIQKIDNDEEDVNATEESGDFDGHLNARKKEHEGLKTLVLDLDETLVHSSFKKVQGADFIIPVNIDGIQHKVYVLVRPHAAEFLKECAKVYEIVLFTASLSKYADPLLDFLDTSGTISHRLFREHCQQMSQCYVKNLDQLGRPVEKCIIVDNSSQSYLMHPKNAVNIPSWFDDKTDTALKDLLPVLKYLALPEIKDVRKELNAGKYSFGNLVQKYTSLYNANLEEQKGS